MKQSSAYTLECNGRLGRAVMEAELQGESGNAASGNGNTGGASNRACADGGGDAAKGSGSSSSVHGGGSAAAGGRVLIGHSLGGACAAAEVINNPEVRREGLHMLRMTQLKALVLAGAFLGALARAAYLDKMLHNTLEPEKAHLIIQTSSAGSLLLQEPTGYPVSPDCLLSATSSPQ